MIIVIIIEELDEQIFISFGIRIKVEHIEIPTYDFFPGPLGSLPQSFLVTKKVLKWLMSNASLRNIVVDSSLVFLVPFLPSDNKNGAAVL